MIRKGPFDQGRGDIKASSWPLEELGWETGYLCCAAEGTEGQWEGGQGQDVHHRVVVRDLNSVLIQ